MCCYIKIICIICEHLIWIDLSSLNFVDKLRCNTPFIQRMLSFFLNDLIYHKVSFINYDSAVRGN
jgi:hypothetical protein